MNIFSIYCNKNQFHDKNVIFNIISVTFLSKTLKKRKLQKIKTLFEKKLKLYIIQTNYYTLKSNKQKNMDMY